MAIVMSVGIGVVAFLVAGVADYISLSDQKRSLQSIADHAALASAHELIVSTAGDDRTQSVAASFVKANYKSPHATTAHILDGRDAVEVTIVAEARTFFPGPMANVKEVTASATAEVSGGGYVCMIGLDTESVATLNMMNRARLTAKDCAVYSNSLSTKSLWLHDLARVSAELICIAGGFKGSEEAFSVSAPITDCAPLKDPLQDRPNPEVGDLDHCDYKHVAVPPGKKVTLAPGIYCGGLSVFGGQVTLKPGVYTMKDGQLLVGGGGVLKGENVGFFLTGPASTILFGRLSEISLTAPRTGDMAGLLFFEDRNTDFSTYHRITSRDARRLVGTM
ncbi:MAG TPA: TadE/TadG family type IV pilus assembly protein, partial [Hyphomonadaceae bacterium]